MNEYSSSTARNIPEMPCETDADLEKDTILGWQSDVNSTHQQLAQEYLESLEKEKRSEALGVFCFIFAPSLLVAWSELGDSFLAFPLMYLLALVACGVYLCMSSDGVKKKNKQFKKSQGYRNILPDLFSLMEKKSENWKNYSRLGVFLLCFCAAPVVAFGMMGFMETVGVALTLLLVAIGVGLECYGSGMLTQKKKVLKKIRKNKR